MAMDVIIPSLSVALFITFFPGPEYHRNPKLPMEHTVNKCRWWWSCNLDYTAASTVLALVKGRAEMAMSKHRSAR